MAYTTLPSLTSWWHSVNSMNHQQCSATNAASLSGNLRPFRRLPHRKAEALPQCAALHAESRDPKQKSTMHAQPSARRSVHKRTRCCTVSASKTEGALGITLNAADTNQLQTALNQAIAAEDYALASKLRDQLQKLVGSNGTADWRQLGVP